MAGDAEATRKRLLQAARKEFGAYGIAGARVDRIAAESGSNKAQIYHYFGSKDGLFDAVFNEIVEHTVSATPIDPTDLPEYAGRLFDGYEQHPEIQRLATWYRLERAGTNDPLDAIIESNRHKTEAIAKAQRDGLLTTRYSPIVLLSLVIHQATLWANMTPEYSALVEQTSSADRRRIVTEAVAALLRD
ncbi:TetR family transcriptional regulator [Kribbella sp. NPDC051770]|uniref:TetR family transcriptional regulator n=1 Tax=Kribbella sp. NPDC051770 TaxID=3155413 RepID=UPI003418466F